MRFITSVTRKPNVEPITISIHGSGLRGVAVPRPPASEADDWRQSGRTAETPPVLSSAESGSRIRHCHPTTPSNQRSVIPAVHRPKQVQPRGIAKVGRRPILVNE